MKKVILSLTFLFLGSTCVMASDYIPCTADEEGSCWPCGDTCTARISYDNEEDKANQRNATITYSGYGVMYNYDSPHNNPELINVEPWWNMRNKITKAIVEEGITILGNRTIYLMTNLTDIELPNSLTSIGAYAFHDAAAKEVIIPQNVQNIHITSLGEGGFVSTLICPESIQKQCENIGNYNNRNIPVKTYQKSGDQFFYDNKWYNSLGDIQSGNHIKKRIYTVDEASKISGKKNNFKIRYK